MHEPHGVDVAVVGSGPSGLIHALAAHALGRTVAVIGAPSTARPGTYELLSGAVAEELSRLDLLGPIRARATRCVGTVYRWNSESFSEQSGSGWSGGWIVDRHWLDPLLRQLAVRRGIALTSQVVRAAGPGAVDGICAAQVVLATGRGSRLPGRAGLTTTHRHRQVAITLERPVRFPELGPRLLVDRARSGWWYAVGDGRLATVGFITDIDLLLPGPDRFGHTWRCSQPSWLPTAARTAAVRGRASGLAMTQAGDPGMDVLGDAALALDPLSGRGLATAVRGALMLAANPQRYRDWIVEQARSHTAAARELYSAAAGKHEFWRRRTEILTG